MKREKWLFVYQNPDGKVYDEILEITPSFKGSTRKIYRAYLIVNLETGLVIKDRANGNSGEILATRHLDVIRRQFGYYNGIRDMKKHFEDDLFTV